MESDRRGYREWQERSRAAIGEVIGSGRRGRGERQEKSWKATEDVMGSGREGCGERQERSRRAASKGAHKRGGGGTRACAPSPIRTRGPAEPRDPLEAAEGRLKWVLNTYGQKGSEMAMESFGRGKLRPHRTVLI